MAAYRPERVYMILTIVCWLISGPVLPRYNRLHLYMALFALVIVASWWASPYQEAGTATVENYLKYAVFYVLLVTSVRDARSLRKILVGHVCIMALFMAHALREYFCGNVWYAQGIMRMKSLGITFSDYNDFAGLVVLGLPFVWVLWHEWPDRWRRGLLLGYVGMSGYCVVLTGSRMGACGVGLAVGMAAVASPYRWRLIAVAPMLLLVAWTMLPEKHQQRYLTMVGGTYEVGGQGTVTSQRFRVGGFERGLELCDQRPLIGFGPMATGRVTETGMMPHNLYGQLLGELGVAGAVAFGLMILGVGQNTFEARRIGLQSGAEGDLLAYRTVLAMAAAFVLLLFMGWGFNFLFWHVWLWFGGFQAMALCCLKVQAESSHAIADSKLGMTVEMADTAWG
jgi:hypothetical protein